MYRSIFHPLTVCPLLLGSAQAVTADDKPPQKAEMAGYLLVPHERVDKKYNAGFSMYVAAWPLLKDYPGQQFQSGLFGTWMFAQLDGPKPEKMYSDIEGGLGWWRDTLRHGDAVSIHSRPEDRLQLARHAFRHGDAVSIHSRPENRLQLSMS